MRSPAVLQPMKQLTRRSLIASALASTPWSSAQTPTQVIRIGRNVDVSAIADIEGLVLRDAFSRVGMRCEFVPLPLLRLIEMANAGEIDGDSGRIAEIAKRYPSLIQVPTPVCKLDIAIYGRTADFALRSRSEIAGMSIGIVRGGFAAIKYSRGMNVTEARDADALANMLTNQRIDAVMAIYIDNEAQLHGVQFPGIVRWPYLWASEPLYCLLHKSHAALVPKLDSALARMQKEGRIARYYAEGLQKFGITQLLAAEAAPK